MITQLTNYNGFCRVAPGKASGSASKLRREIYEKVLLVTGVDQTNLLKMA